MSTHTTGNTFSSHDYQKKINKFLLINGIALVISKMIIIATDETMMTVLWMVNQPLAAAMT